MNASMNPLNLGYHCIVLAVLLLASDAGAATLFPANDAKDVCPDTPLRIVFDSAPSPGAGGTIKVFDADSKALVESIDAAAKTATQSIGGLGNYKYYPILLKDKQASIYLHDGALAYGKTYDVTVDPGVFGTAAQDWRFTTRSAVPAPAGGRLTVAADGSGDFCTVQGAVDSIPAGNSAPVTIFIRKGVYTEMVNLSAKNRLTFLGEDRKKTIIEYATNNNFNNAPGRYRRGVFQASGCSDLTLSNLTIHNTTPQGGSQAEAIILNGSGNARAILSDVDLYSYQDTLQINGQAFVKDCYIEGDVDFMWGTGPCYFENCECKALRKKAYYTQIRNLASNHGYVYHHCTFDGAPGVMGNFLARIDPGRFPASEVVLIDCTLTESVGAVAWKLDVHDTPADVHYWEFNSHDAQGKPVEVSRRLAMSRHLKQPDDAALIAQYADAAFVLGHAWNPVAPALPAIPAAVFDVKSNGAVADGKTDNAAAIQKAIASAVAAGGGVVKIPAADQPYFSGPITLASGINLEIETGAVLQMLPYGKYPLRGNSYPNFINGSNLHDVAITGGGRIEGGGAPWWAAFRANASMPHRPFLVRLNNCERVLVSGLTFSNSPMFHVAMGAVNNLTIEGITINAPANAPNSDGIDPSGIHQLIENCRISVGDDNIAVKPGGAFCSDITVAHCVFGAGHGVSVGGQTNRGLDGMAVFDCTFTDTTSGLRMKADATQGGLVRNVSFSNLTMNNVAYPIVFYSYYNKVGNPGSPSGTNQTTPAKVLAWNATPPDPLDRPTLPAWRHISIENVTATGGSGYNLIWGLPLAGYLIDDVELKDVQITGGKGFEIYNASNVRFSGETKIDNLITANSLAIVKQPESASVPVDGSATLSVSVAGKSGVTETGPAFQWNFNGMPIAGATGEALTLNHVQAANAGDYTVTISNSLDGYDVGAGALAAGHIPVSATSNIARVSVVSR